jgi:adenylosuccinate lyase
MSRRAAYELVQRHALLQAEQSRGGQVGPSFCDRLLADPELHARLSEEALRACFDLSIHLRHVPEIIERALGKQAG